jgi:hypothetical protein
VDDVIVVAVFQGLEQKKIENTFFNIHYRQSKRQQTTAHNYNFFNLHFFSSNRLRWLSSFSRVSIERSRILWAFLLLSKKM